MSAKHTPTPGPWEFTVDGTTPIHIFALDGRWKGRPGTSIAEVGGDIMHGTGDFQETVANARLIAAAPELLAAAEAGLGALERELAGLLETSCLLDDELNPRRDTLDASMVETIEEMEAEIATAHFAIAKATGAA